MACLIRASCGANLVRLLCTNVLFATAMHERLHLCVFILKLYSFILFNATVAMPESGEVKGFAHAIETGKGSGLTPEVYNELECKHHHVPSEFLTDNFFYTDYFQISPLAFSLGSEKRAYTSVTVVNERDPGPPSPSTSGLTDDGSINPLSTSTINPNGLDVLADPLLSSSGTAGSAPGIGFQSSSTAASTVTAYGPTPTPPDVVPLPNNSIILPTWVAGQHSACRDGAWPPQSWRNRAYEKPWAYLLDEPKSVGRLVCTKRGKLLTVAAGQVGGSSN